MAVLAVVGLVFGIIDLTEGWAKGAASGWAWAALFGGLAGVLWRRGGPRWTGITLCAVLGMVALVAGIFYLTEGFTNGVATSWAVAALLAALAVVLWRRNGARPPLPQKTATKHRRLGQCSGMPPGPGYGVRECGGPLSLLSP